MTGIIQIDDIIKIFNLSPEAGNALKVIFSRFQEVTKNLINIAAQLLNHLISWTGLEIDPTHLNDININNNNNSPNLQNQPNTIPDSSSSNSNDNIIHNNGQ
jgi:hypothetical protein